VYFLPAANILRKKASEYNIFMVHPFKGSDVRRYQLFEIHDQSWCPKIVRNALTSFLQTAIELLNTYEPIRAQLAEAITASGANSVIDLCSGAGGPWLKWTSQGLTNAPVTLTDRRPNSAAIEHLATARASGVRYYPTAVDATNVSPELSGFRTVFTAFHHLTPDQAKAVIDDAVQNAAGIGIFELTSRKPKSITSMLLTPIGVWLFTPLTKRIHWSVFALTYILPVVPFVAFVDGVLSCLRSYTANELRVLADCSEFVWSAGEEKGITYLIGMRATKHTLT
jgi:hypothetical protein